MSYLPQTNIPLLHGLALADLLPSAPFLSLSSSISVSIDYPALVRFSSLGKALVIPNSFASQLSLLFSNGLFTSFPPGYFLLYIPTSGPLSHRVYSVTSRDHVSALSAFHEHTPDYLLLFVGPEVHSFLRPG